MYLSAFHSLTTLFSCIYIYSHTSQVYDANLNVSGELTTSADSGTPDAFIVVFVVVFVWLSVLTVSVVVVVRYVCAKRPKDKPLSPENEPLVDKDLHAFNNPNPISVPTPSVVKDDKTLEIYQPNSFPLTSPRPDMSVPKQEENPDKGKNYIVISGFIRFLIYKPKRLSVHVHVFIHSSFGVKLIYTESVPMTHARGMRYA